MNKVLIISYQFPPDTGSVQRVLKYAQYLSDFGWSPTILTHKIGTDQHSDYTALELLSEHLEIIRVGSPDSIVGRIRNKYSQKLKTDSSDVIGTDREISRSITKRTPIQFLKKAYRKICDILFWPDKYIWWMPFAFVASWKAIKENKYKVLYSVSPPHSTLMIGLLLKMLTNIPWVVDFRDPWANDPDTVIPSIFHRKAHCWAESIVLRLADVVITTTDNHSNYMKTILPPKSKAKIVTITNGFDPKDIVTLSPRLNEKFTIAYAGGFYTTRNPSTFLKGLQIALGSHPELKGEIQIQIIGSTHAMVIDEVAQLGLSDVISFPGYLSHSKTMEMLARSTVLLLVVHSYPLIAQISIPAKLFEYLAIGRPILAITPPGASADLIQDLGCGVLIQPEDAEGVANAICRYYFQYLEGKLLGASCDEAALKPFHRRTLTGKLAAVFDDLVRGKPC